MSYQIQNFFNNFWEETSRHKFAENLKTCVLLLNLIFSWWVLSMVILGIMTMTYHNSTWMPVFLSAPIWNLNMSIWWISRSPSGADSSFKLYFRGISILLQLYISMTCLNVGKPLWNDLNRLEDCMPRILVPQRCRLCSFMLHKIPKCCWITTQQTINFVSMKVWKAWSNLLVKAFYKYLSV